MFIINKKTRRPINTLKGKLIVHVLDKSFGLGDFLRGTIFLAHFCKKHNMQFRLNISNHDISCAFNVVKEQVLNAPTFIPHTKNININSLTDKNYITTNKFYDKRLITDDIKQYINSYLTIKPLYYDKVKQLFNVENYKVLHIRCTDENFTTDFEDTLLYDEIRKLNLINTIVISNNNLLKQKINKLFGFHYINQPTMHTVNITKNAIESTIIDYIILSKSSHTYCFSYYGHGSGFSEQCSFLHNVPYNVKCL